MPKKNKNYPINDSSSDKVTLQEPLLTLSHNINTRLQYISEGVQKVVSQLTSFEKMHVVREGVSKKDLEVLKSKTKMDYTSLAKALSVTRATLINKKRSDRFNVSLSEKIVGLADLYSFGFEVFEEEDLFNQWMQKPNKALGGEVPLDIIDNQFGREEVKNVIGRIAYGVYS